MKRINTKLSILMIMLSTVLSTLPGNVIAQSRWSLEFRPSLAFPTSHLADTKLNTGFGFDGIVTYRFIQNLYVYGGWGWNLFPQDKSHGFNYSNEATGYLFGLQFMHALPESEISYFLRGGGIFNHLELKRDHRVFSDSGHELGWQFESGVSLPLDYGISVNPSIRYSQFSGTIIQDGTTRKEFNLDYLSIGIGVSKNFRKR